MPKFCWSCLTGLTNFTNSVLQENEKTRDIIIEQRFHRTMIGARGDHIKEIKDKFNQVQITFPDPGKKSDIVTLRGPKDDVDKCHKHLQQMHQDMVSFYLSLSFTHMHFRPCVCPAVSWFPINNLSSV